MSGTFDLASFIVPCAGGAAPGLPRGARPGRSRPAPSASKSGLRRNDTSYPAKAAAKLRELYAQYVTARTDPADPSHGWASILKYYQFLVRAVMSDPEYGIGADGNARGLLVYHTMGMGKTRLAVAVAMAMWDVRPPVVLLARGLQKNFGETVETVVSALHPGASPEALAALKKEALARFTFVSMDAYNAADQMARAGTGAKHVKRGDIAGATGGLDGKLLIVDEAHNFFRAIINSSAENANARRVYEMIMAARNLRIVFLTGTPAAKDPFELVPCFNMLAGTDLLPTQYEVFYELYVDRVARKVRNRGLLANRLVGLVSHVTHSRPSDPPGNKAGAALAPKKVRDDGWFPEGKPTIIDRVEMGPDQYRQYLLAREKEEAEGRGGEGSSGRAAAMTMPPLSLPGSEKKAMRSYYVKSRSLGNFAAPREWIGKPIDLMPDEAFTPATGPKLAKIAERADKAPGPVLVYSQFVDFGGLKPLGRFLQLRGYDPFTPELPAKQPFGRKAPSSGPALEDTKPAAEPPGPAAETAEEAKSASLGGGRGRGGRHRVHERTIGGLRTFSDEARTYDVEKLWQLTAGLPAKEWAVASLEWQLDEPCWHEDDSPDLTPRTVLHNMRAYPEHAAAIRNADFAYPVLLVSRKYPDERGEVVIADGMHRLCRAVLEKRKYISAQLVPLEILAEAAISDESKRGGASPRKGYYAIISGEVPNEVRDAIKATFNLSANAHGEKIKAILVSKTGAEGLDLKWIRETHQLEPYWDRARDDQVKSRAERQGSHDGLPREEREVQPYLYMAIANQKIWGQMLERDREVKTIDEQFADRARERYDVNAAFRQLLVEVSLECEIFGYGACRVCVPTNAPLFHDDPALDARLPDPCEVRQESDVEAKPIRVGGVTYFYTVDPAAPLGYAFYAYRDDLGGYAPVDPADPIVQDLLRAVSPADRDE